MILLMASTALAGEMAGMVGTWSDMRARHALMNGEVVNRNGVEMLKLTNKTGREWRAEVFEIDLPNNARRAMQSSYAITGEVEYEDVEGMGYLEMLSYFPPPKSGPFFSRTLSPSGPTGWLTGSGRRKFEVPFFLSKGDAKPIKLEFNLVLPGKGTIYLSPVKLVLNRPGIDGRVVFGKWRSPQELGRMGGTLGAILGAFGGLVGILGGIIGVLAGRGKARAFVLGTMRTLIGTGILFLIVGLVLAVTRQWWVFYVPFFFMGLLLLAIVTPMLSMMRRHYDELELRRISAQDAMG